MKTPECSREAEVVAAIVVGRWPNPSDSELQSHAAACPICSDVVQVAQALHEGNGHASQDARIPSAGLVWWRSELRARREAMRTAERPLRLVHAFGAACGLGIFAALIAQLSPWVRELLIKFGAINVSAAATVLLQQHLPLVLGLGVLVVLAPVALYFVFSDK